MSDRHLRHLESMHQGKRRKKPVHPFEEPDPLQDRPSEDLEGATRVVHAVMGKDIPHPIRNLGREFLHHAVLPLLPPPTHHVVRRRIREEFQDVFAVLLEIAVYLDNDLAGGLVKTGFQRTGFAIIPVEVEHPHIGMFARQSVQLVAAAVAAAVVHEEDLVRAGARQFMRIHDFQETGDEGRQVVSFILDRDDH